MEWIKIEIKVEIGFCGGVEAGNRLGEVNVAERKGGGVERLIEKKSKCAEREVLSRCQHWGSFTNQ